MLAGLYSLTKTQKLYGVNRRALMFVAFLLRWQQRSFENLYFTVVADIVIHSQMPYARHHHTSFNVFKLFWCEVRHFNDAIMLNPVIPFFHTPPPILKRLA